MSKANGAARAILANDVWVRFWITRHRREMTLREVFVSLFRRRTHDLAPAPIARDIPAPAGPAQAPRPARAGERTSIWALRGVDLSILPGEIVGLIGRNGAGKTTLLKTLGGICTPDRGGLAVRGRVGCMLNFGVGFNENLSGRENVYLNGSMLGMSRREIDGCIANIIRFSELGEFMDAPARSYSAGMRARLGFSIVVHLEPDVLLLDEVLGVGDAAFRAKAGDILDHLLGDCRTVVLATHNLDLVRDRCTRAVWLDEGRIRADGDADSVCDEYLDGSGVRPLVVSLPRSIRTSLHAAGR